jgi:glycosyl transferase family 25
MQYQWPEEIKHAFVISMRPVRWESFQERLGPWSQYITLWNATNGYHLNLEELKKNNIVAKTARLIRGQVGCYMSHVNVWKHIVENNLPLTLIMEDDADLRYCQSHCTMLNECMTELKKYKGDWDFLYLGRGKQVNWPEDMSPKDLPPLFSRPRGCGGIFCYILTLNGAKKMLQYVYPFFYPIDVLVARLHDSEKINAISLRKRIGFVVSIESDTSTIE